MKSIVRYSLFFIAIISLATSCKKSVPAQTKYIPKGAMFVLDMDWKSLSEKAGKANINWDSLFSSAAGKNPSIADAKKRFEEFMHSGVDLESNVFMFVQSGGSIMNGQTVSGGIVAGIKDAAVFESYIKKQPEAGEVKKESNYSSITIMGDIFVGWNKDVVIVSGASTQGQENAGAATAAQVLTPLFSQKEDESVASIPEFADLVQEKGDIIVWTNSSNALNTVPLLGLTKAADLLKDSYAGGKVNFEDGKVVADFKSYSGKDLAEIWKKYAGPAVNMDMVNQYPSPVSGFAAFSFNPEIITEIIKFAGMESTANQFLDKAGFNLSDITKAFKGDFAIVFSDLGIKETENNYDGMKISGTGPVGKLLFNAAIGDKAAYDKIVTSLAKSGDMVEENGQFIPPGFDGISWNMNGKNLVIATDSTLVQPYLTGKGNASLPADIAEKSKGKSVAIYLNINQVLQSISGDSSTHKSIEMAKGTFKDMMVTSDNFNGKYVGSNFQLTLVNDKENSLAALIKFFAAFSKQIEHQQKKFMEEEMGDMDMNGMDMDSTGVAKPAPDMKEQ
ncbi:MAG TPA: DUF4836 family protein [Panacibacter sp.]|nr:DUF4836 family protein [Panacibacter sp.]